MVIYTSRVSTTIYTTNQVSYRTVAAPHCMASQLTAVSLFMNKRVLRSTLLLFSRLFPSPHRATRTCHICGLLLRSWSAHCCTFHCIPCLPPPLAMRQRSDPAPRDCNFRDAPGKKTCSYYGLWLCLGSRVWWAPLGTCLERYQRYASARHAL